MCTCRPLSWLGRWARWLQEEERGDMPELDDCEEDDHFDPNDTYDDEVWKGYTQEQIKQFKILGARLEQEEVRTQPKADTMYSVEGYARI